MKLKKRMSVRHTVAGGEPKELVDVKYTLELQELYKVFQDTLLKEYADHNHNIILPKTYIDDQLFAESVRRCWIMSINPRDAIGSMFSMSQWKLPKLCDFQDPSNISSNLDKYFGSRSDYFKAVHHDVSGRIAHYTKWIQASSTRQGKSQRELCKDLGCRRQPYHYPFIFLAKGDNEVFNIYKEKLWFEMATEPATRKIVMDFFKAHGYTHIINFLEHNE